MKMRGNRRSNQSTLRWYAWRGQTDSETKFFFQMCTPSLGVRCGVFIFLLLCLVTPLLPVVYIRLIVYFQPPLVALYIPCVGRMAVERCLGYFVILACSRDVWEKLSSGTSLNKQCLSAYNK